MDQSTPQQERLDQLVELLQSGRLSETDYMRARVAVLKNEQVPEDIVLLPPKSNTAFPDSNPLGGMSGLPRDQRSQNNLSNHPPQKLASSFDPVRPNLADDSRSSWGSITPAIDLRGEQQPLSVIQNARERRATREFQQFEEEEERTSVFLPLLAIFGIALVVTAVMSTTGENSESVSSLPPPPAYPPVAPAAPVVEKPRPKRLIAATKVRKSIPSTPKAIRRSTKTAFRPLFGPEARSECLQHCSRLSSSAQSACERGCSRFSLKDYARRISHAVPNPKGDARKIAGRCLIAAQDLQTSATREQWKNAMGAAMTTVNVRAPRANDYTSLRSLYSASARVLDSLALMTNASDRERSITSAARQATCLRANLALTELAKDLSKQRQDTFSLRFYSTLGNSLREITREVEDHFVLLYRQTRIR